MATFPSPAPDRPRRLVIHIGDHKTGSTSIQYAFAQKAVTLEGETVFYPTKLSHNYLRKPAKALIASGAPKKRAAAEETFARLAGRIRGSGADIALISAEGLEDLPAARLRHIADRWLSDAADELRVVAYVRPHAARLVSSFATQTKSGVFAEGGLTAFHAKFLKQKRLFYHARFSALRDAFGEAFVLRPMIRDQLEQGDVVHDFVRHGLGVQDYRIGAFTRGNESLRLGDLMRLQLLQQQLQHLPGPVRHALGWEFTRLLAQLPPPAGQERLQMHRALAQEVHAAYIDDARAMDRDFFDGIQLLETAIDNARAEAAEAPMPSDPAEYFPEPELRSLQLTASLVAELLQTPSIDWAAELRTQRLATLEQETGATG